LVLSISSIVKPKTSLLSVTPTNIIPPSPLANATIVLAHLMGLSELITVLNSY